MPKINSLFLLVAKGSLTLKKHLIYELRKHLTFQFLLSAAGFKSW